MATKRQYVFDCANQALGEVITTLKERFQSKDPAYLRYQKDMDEVRAIDKQLKTLKAKAKKLDEAAKDRFKKAHKIGPNEYFYRPTEHLDCIIKKQPKYLAARKLFEKLEEFTMLGNDKELAGALTQFRRDLEMLVK